MSENSPSTVEIERKFLVDVDKLHSAMDLNQYESHKIEQAYISSNPVNRIRRKDDKYIFTFKGSGKTQRTEVEFSMTEEQYLALCKEVTSKIIKKTRYKIPYNQYTIELDFFEGDLAPLVLAEVEFASLSDAQAFVGPDWFTEDVSEDGRYHNSYLAYN